MKLTPVEINQKKFGKKVMGCDPYEVTEFMQLISREFENLLTERDMLRDHLREHEMRMIEYKERDQILKDTIQTAHKMAEKSRFDADRESKLIVNEAHQRAEIITRDARDSVKKIYSDISNLKRIKAHYENQLKALSETVIKMCDEGGNEISKNLLSESHHPSI